MILELSVDQVNCSRGSECDWSACLSPIPARRSVSADVESVIARLYPVADEVSEPLLDKNTKYVVPALSVGALRGGEVCFPRRAHVPVA